jgi:hypothetical protein
MQTDLALVVLISGCIGFVVFIVYLVFTEHDQ